MPFDGVELQDWQKTLLRAAQIIRENGLLQGAYGFNGGPACAVGAIFRTGFFNRPEVFTQARDNLAKHVGVGRPSMWNDEPGRTAEEVASTMERAALMEISHAQPSQA